MSRRVSLSVNNNPIELDYFVQGFIDHTTGGMIEALEGTGKIKTLNISIKNSDVTVTINNANVPVNRFVSIIIKNTVCGMVSSLKGVDTIDRLELDIERTV